MPTVVLSPFNVAGFPEGGGHFWVYLQYVEGLRQLGCDVYWLENFPVHSDARVFFRFFEQMDRFGLGERTILYWNRGQRGGAGSGREYVGMSELEAEAVFERADLLLNFHYAISPALLARFRRTALVDIDPGLLQFWISRGQLTVPGHDLYFTTGETVGMPGSLIPDCGLEWNRIRPPVSLAHWPSTIDANAEAFTTVSSWDASDWIVDGDEVYENTKRVAFLEFVDLPRFNRQPLELALFLRTERDLEERLELEKRGWRIRSSREVASTPEAYRSYVQQSRGEFSCAKRSCMRLQNAWISDRTLCYLASGKPAVVQNTGKSAFLPEDEGLFRFSTLREAADALEAVNGDYEHHCRAARRIAETWFDARQVLGNVLTAAVD